MKDNCESLMAENCYKSESNQAKHSKCTPNIIYCNK